MEKQLVNIYSMTFEIVLLTISIDLISSRILSTDEPQLLLQAYLSVVWLPTICVEY